MQKINVLFDGDLNDCDIICVPQCVLDDLENISYLCSKWLYDNIDNHDFWILGKNERRIVNFETESLIWWLNNHYIESSEKAYIEAQHVQYMAGYATLDL